jgi:hypothetical protein
MARALVKEYGMMRGVFLAKNAEGFILEARNRPGTASYPGDGNAGPP